eukprot:4191541-Pyramimonas_sp.AAC.1
MVAGQGPTGSRALQGSPRKSRTHGSTKSRACLRGAQRKFIELRRQRSAVLAIVMIGVRVEHLRLPNGIS